MNRCSPVDMRKNLEIVNHFKDAGIDFVAMPALNEEDKRKILSIMIAKLEVIEILQESTEEG